MDGGLGCANMPLINAHDLDLCRAIGRPGGRSLFDNSSDKTKRSETMKRWLFLLAVCLMTGCDNPSPSTPKPDLSLWHQHDFSDGSDVGIEPIKNNKLWTCFHAAGGVYCGFLTKRKKDEDLIARGTIR